MPCDYIRTKFNMWSDEKRRIVLTALGGAVSCRYCKKVHYLEGKPNESN